MTHTELLDQARTYIREGVYGPALRSPVLAEKYKNVIRDSAKWLGHFDKIGDLFTYLKRCTNVPSARGTFAALQAAGLKSYEQILPEFERRFGDWLNFRTTPADFLVGNQYSTFQLVIFGERYDPRSGGIFPIGQVGTHIAVVVKANLKGKYKNEWLEHGSKLKYYLKSRESKGGRPPLFSEKFLENRAIIEFPDIPVLVFVRNHEPEPFVYFGEFGSVGVHTEENGSKWFELIRRDHSFAVPAVVEIQNDLEKKVARARKLSGEQRKKKLLESLNKKPKKKTAFTEVFDRNPYVIAEVLELANGLCHSCRKPAPFARATDGSPYLEVHHIVPLAEGGDDTIDNAVALCPNCHRYEHYGAPRVDAPSNQLDTALFKE